MITELSIAFSSIKTVIDITNGLKASHDSATITQVQSDIRKHLLTIQAEALTLQDKHLALLHEKEELIKKVVQFEQWEKTESEYTLQELALGVIAYSYNDSQDSTIPHHWLCTNCYNDRKKSILQIQSTMPVGARKYACPRCKFIFNK